MSHATRQVFGGRSRGVCPIAVIRRLFGALAGHRGRAGGRRIRVEVAAAGHQRAHVGVQVVAQRNTGRNVEPGDVIVPDLRVGKTVLIAAHGNSLRALVKYLDGMSDQEVTALNIPTGIPLRYDLDADMRPLVSGGSYLDPDAAAAGAAAVASQGAK